MLGQIKGRVLVDEAGVQSTFSTTLNKKSHANRHITLELGPTLESKAPVQGQAKVSLLLMVKH